MSLVRKELIRPELPTLPGQEAFGFRHALIRDAAYASLPKQARDPSSTSGYAAWLEHTLGDRASRTKSSSATTSSRPTATESSSASTRRQPTTRRRAPAVCSPRPVVEHSGAATRRRRSTCSSAPARCLPGRAKSHRLSSCRIWRSRSSKAEILERANAQWRDEALNARELPGDRHAVARAAVTRFYCAYFSHPGPRSTSTTMQREAEESLAVFNETERRPGAQTRALFVLHRGRVVRRGDADATGAGQRAGISSTARRAGSRSDEA